MIPRPPTSTLFPYTTLFRSLLSSSPVSASRSASPGWSRNNSTSASQPWARPSKDRKSTRLNSSHVKISYAVFCLKKKKKKKNYIYTQDEYNQHNEQIIYYKK